MNKEKLIENRNQELYDKVHQVYKINLKKSDDHSWGSHTTKDAFIISHSQTKHPVSAFTHELLHADTQLNGYKRIRGGLSLDLETHEHLRRICTCIDNEFQHHKMFDKFISLGFPADEFYNDLDTEIIPYLENIINTPSKSFISLAVDFLTLIAPGGIIPLDKLEELKQSFYNYDGVKYREKFEIIEKIIEDWKADLGYDAEAYIVRFFQNLDAGPTWITYSDNLDKGVSSDNFPSTGFFTDRSFTIQEIVKAFDN